MFASSWSFSSEAQIRNTREMLSTCPLVKFLNSAYVVFLMVPLYETMVIVTAGGKGCVRRLREEARDRRTAERGSRGRDAVKSTQWITTPSSGLSAISDTRRAQLSVTQ